MRQTPRRKFGISEAFVLLLGLCLISSLIALYRLEVENESYKQRLQSALKTTSDTAKSSQKRLKKAINILKEEDSNLVDIGNVTPEVQKNDIVGKTTVIIFCYSRPTYLERTFNSILERIPNAKLFNESGLRVLISQDGKEDGVRVISEKFVRDLTSKGIESKHIQHERYVPRQKGPLSAYFSLATHYAKGLKYAFKDGSQRVIILEDDLELARDFFEYFQAFAPILDVDESLLAVSAWNDHGQESHIGNDPKLIYRTDFFPGLGWMMPLRIWQELGPKWPQGFWDDWLREPAQRKERHCIRPEISRTITFGRSGGASGGQFFDLYLASMKLNEVVPDSYPVDLLQKQKFDEWFMQKVYQAQLVKTAAEIVSKSIEYKINYTSFTEYVRICKQLKVMDDIKANVPRGAYRGVLPIKYQGAQIYLTPVQIPALQI